MEKNTNNKIEREYVIPLREKIRPAARYKKTPKAIKSIKQFVARHMKIYDRDLNKIKVDTNVNEFMWARGIKNPPQSIKIKAIKDAEGLVRVELVDYPNKLKFKKLRQEKMDKEAKEATDKKKTLKEKVQDQVKGTFRKEEKTVKEEKVEESEEKKEEVKEKEKTSAEAEEKIEKDLAKKEKHTTKAKSGAEKLAEKKEYDQRSQGK